jgi:hypothetical protein
LGRAIAVSGGKQRSVGAALTEENRGGGRERWHRWMAKGNGGEDGATCLPTGDDRGGVSDRGGATRGGGDDSSVVLPHERRLTRRRVVARWVTPPDRRA